MVMCESKIQTIFTNMQRKLSCMKLLHSEVCQKKVTNLGNVETANIWNKAGRHSRYSLTFAGWAHCVKVSSADLPGWKLGPKVCGSARMFYFVGIFSYLSQYRYKKWVIWWCSHDGWLELIGCVSRTPSLPDNLCFPIYFFCWLCNLQGCGAFLIFYTPEFVISLTVLS